ncbi:metallophosphoesterase family protein [Desulforudis sp. 1088]|uniref:metallophosphoesterase family protein n=1 Tax=unclassified Candidatus Desulforudis TaxID=2635950 RepID=UPI00349622A3
MKLLYLTDTHIRGTNPKYRLDDFASTLRAKLIEVVGLVETHRVDFVIHGGDVFDMPSLPLPVVGDFMEILARIRAPIYAVAGNHDIYAYNPETLDRTMLGFLSRLGHFRLLQPGSPVYVEAGGVRVQLSGMHFHYAMDRRDFRMDYCVRKVDCDFAIHTTHGLLLTRPVAPEIPHTLAESVAQNTEADLTLGSHAHFGFAPVTFDGRTVANPGALARLSPQPADVQRRPQVLLIDLTGEKPAYVLIPLTSAPLGSTVIDTQQANNFTAREAVLSDYLKGWGSASTLEDVLHDLAQRDTLSEKVRDEAMHRLQDARKGIG